MKNLSFIILLLLVQVTLLAQKPIVNITPFAEDLKDYLFTIGGTLYDQETNEPIIFGNIAIYNADSKLITGVEADLDGRYQFQNIKPGSYILEASFIGYKTKRTEITIVENLTEFNLFLDEGAELICCFMTCGRFDKPLIDISNPSYITTFKSYDIANQYKSQNNSWNLHFTIHEKKKDKKKKKRKKKSKIKESTIAPDMVQPNFDEFTSEERSEKKAEGDNQKETEVKIFPNPSNGLVNIQSKLPIIDISTFNSQGQLVDQIVVHSENSRTLDLSNLAAGMYFIHIQHEEGNLVQQITILD